MLTSINSDFALISSVLILASFAFIVYAFLLKAQDEKLNWALFYSTFYVVVVLPIINYYCVKFNLWHFTADNLNSIQLPFDIYFLWVLIWGIFPFYLLRGKYLVIISVVLFWLDIVTMPLLEKIGVVSLNENWLIGEILIILFVFIPAYYWAFISYENKNTGIRALLQVIVMGIIFLVGFPFILESYYLVNPITFYFAPYTFQLFIIVVFPALVAVLDLVQKGKGTPFPYDPTKKLIQTSVYAYCRNPIQWSFTLMFIPLSIYFSSFYFLLGSVFSVAYSFGVSDYQEYEDMEKRFGNDWVEYKKNIPKWRFLWLPKTIPKGEVYFDANCNQCSQISKWFLNSNAINLDVKASYDFLEDTILQVTYIDHHGYQYKSIKAIACSLEHINLAYACLGWFMRFPIINNILQSIIDTMEFEGDDKDMNVK